VRVGLAAPLVLVLALAMLAPAQLPAEAQTAPKLTPYPAELRLVAGTPGPAIEKLEYYYSGPLQAPEGAVSCELSLSFIDGFGLRPKPHPNLNSFCILLGGTWHVKVYIAFDGVYNGGGGLYKPVSVELKFYYANGTLAGATNLDVEPVEVKPAQLWLVYRSHSNVRPISSSKLAVGITITVFTSADVRFDVMADGALTAPAQVVIRYSQEGLGPASKQVTIEAGRMYAEVTLESLDVTRPLNYEIVSAEGAFHIRNGTIDLPSQVGGDKVRLSFMLLRPYIVRLGNETEGRVTVRWGVYITEFSAPSHVQLAVKISVGDREDTQRFGPGSAGTLIRFKLENVDPSATSGTYEVKLEGVPPPGWSATVQFSLVPPLRLGGVIKNLFQLIFMAIVGASAAATLAGLFLRRPEMMSAGLLGMAAATMVLMVPTLMAYALSLLFAAGLQDPAQVGDVNMMTLGEAVDNSIKYTQDMAVEFGERLIDLGKFLLGVIAAAAIPARVLGLSGILVTLFSWAMIAFFVGHALKVLAAVYVVVLNVVFVILFLVVVVQALFAAFTGNIGQAFGPVVQFSVLTLIVMLVPSLLATIEQMKGEEVLLTLPVVGDIPNPFFWLAATLLQLFILVMVMYIAITRVVAVLGGGL